MALQLYPGQFRFGRRHSPSQFGLPRSQPAASLLDRNKSDCVLFGSVQGRHSLHPTDQDLSVGILARMVAPTSTPDFHPSDENLSLGTPDFQIALSGYFDSSSGIAPADWVLASGKRFQGRNWLLFVPRRVHSISPGQPVNQSEKGFAGVSLPERVISCHVYTCWPACSR